MNFVIDCLAVIGGCTVFAIAIIAAQAAWLGFIDRLLLRKIALERKTARSALSEEKA